MSNHKPFEQCGVISAIDNERVTVQFNVQSACANCHARTSCIANSSEEREAVISTHDAHLYNIGDAVHITISQELGAYAILIAYVAPLIILILSLVILLALGLNEGVAAIFSLFLAAIYFFLVYLLRNKLQKRFKFTIKRE